MSTDSRTESEAPKPKPKWKVPFVWFEGRMNQLDLRLGNSFAATFRVFEYLGKLSVLVAVLFFIIEIPDRRQQALTDAWLLVNSGSEGIAGRRHALEYLASKGEPLEGVRLVKADLTGIDFEGADLRKISILSSDLSNANLQRADLRRANLNGTVFHNANLTAADLSNTVLGSTKFSGADLSGANLEGALMTDIFAGPGPDFTGAKGLTSEQIKKTEHWEFAIFDEHLQKQLELAQRPGKPK